MGKGAYRAAADGFARIVAADPYDHIAFQGLAIACLCLGEYAQALDAITRALILDPTCVEYLIVRAEAHRKSNDLDRARADLQRALELAPSAFAAYNNLGVVEKAAGNYAAADGLFRRAIGLKPDYVDAIYNLARLSAQTGEMAAAEKCLAEARRLQPADPRFHVPVASLVEAAPTVPAVARAVEAPVDAGADRRLLAALAAQLEAGRVRLDLDVAKLSAPKSPVHRASDSNQAFALVFALMALAAWLAPLVASIPLALALLAGYQLLLPRYLRLRLEKRIRTQSAADLDEWQKLWHFGGVALAMAGDPPRNSDIRQDWRRFAEPAGT